MFEQETKLLQRDTQKDKERERERKTCRDRSGDLKINNKMKDMNLKNKTYSRDGRMPGISFLRLLSLLFF
jgi:hypothetical protein